MALVAQHSTTVLPSARASRRPSGEMATLRIISCPGMNKHELLVSCSWLRHSIGCFSSPDPAAPAPVLTRSAEIFLHEELLDTVRNRPRRCILQNAVVVIEPGSHACEPLFDASIDIW